MGKIGAPTALSRLACRCLVLWLALLAACEADSLKPPLPPADQLYWDIALNHRAVVLSTTAPYDTIALKVTPRNVDGEPLAGAPAPRYVSRDVNHVVITEDGTIRAIEAGSEPVWVVATLTWGKLTYQDSVYVKVVDEPNPPVLASFSIQPIPPDSAKTAEDRSALIPVYATDTAGTPIPGLVTSFRSSNTNVASVDRVTGQVTGLMPGAVMIDASVTAFGVAKADTVRYRIGWPVWVAFSVWQKATPERPAGFSPSEITVGTGAMVSWYMFEKDRTTIDITFNDDDAPNVMPINTTKLVDSLTLDFLCSTLQTDCDAGGSFVVSPMAEFGGAMRVLAAPGVYEFHSAALGLSGRVTVVDER